MQLQNFEHGGKTLLRKSLTHKSGTGDAKQCTEEMLKKYRKMYQKVHSSVTAAI